MKSMFLLTTAALLAAAPALAQEATTQDADAQSPATTTEMPAAAASADLVATAKAQGQFTTLTKAIEAAGMTDQLKNGQFVTIFAPTDAAFAALPEGTVENLMKPENKAQLKALLTNHVVPGYANSEFLSKQANVVMETMGGEKVTIDTQGGALTVSGGKVVTADVRATNGLIHAIDRVILPSAEQASVNTSMDSAASAAL